MGTGGRRRFGSRAGSGVTARTSTRPIVTLTAGAAASCNRAGRRGGGARRSGGG